MNNYDNDYHHIAKHGTMTVIDGISLLIDAFNNLSRRWNVGIPNLGGAIAGDYVSCDSLTQRYRVI